MTPNILTKKILLQLNELHYGFITKERNVFSKKHNYFSKELLIWGCPPYHSIILSMIPTVRSILIEINGRKLTNFWLMMPVDFLPRKYFCYNKTLLLSSGSVSLQHICSSLLLYILLNIIVIQCASITATYLFIAFIIYIIKHCYPVCQYYCSIFLHRFYYTFSLLYNIFCPKSLRLT